MNGTDLPDCEICVADPEASTYRIYNSIVIGILVPVVGVLGIVGNALSAAVYSLPAMRSSVNMYLFALAISDIVVVITGIFLYFLLSIECAGPFVTMIYGLGASYVFPVSHIAQTSSVYLVVCAAIDCFVSTVGPVSIRKHMCTVQNARRAVIAIAIFSVVYNLPHWFEIEVVDCYEAQWNMTLVMLTQTALRLNELYITVYYIYMYTAVLTVGPLALLIILNSTIIIKTVCTKKDSDSREGEDTFTLIMVVFLFIFCNMLALGINLSESFADLGQAFSYLVDLSNLLVIINSSANFVIYFASGESFRRSLIFYLQHKFRKSSKKSRLQQSDRNADYVADSSSQLIKNGAPPAVVSKCVNMNGSRRASERGSCKDWSATEFERLLVKTPAVPPKYVNMNGTRRASERGSCTDCSATEVERLQGTAPAVPPKCVHMNGTRRASERGSCTDCSTTEFERLLDTTPAIIVNWNAKIARNSCTSESERECIFV